MEGLRNLGIVCGNSRNLLMPVYDLNDVFLVAILRAIFTNGKVNGDATMGTSFILQGTKMWYTTRIYVDSDDPNGARKTVETLQNLAIKIRKKNPHEQCIRVVTLKATLGHAGTFGHAETFGIDPLLATNWSHVPNDGVGILPMGDRNWISADGDLLYDLVLVNPGSGESGAPTAFFATVSGENTELENMKLEPIQSIAVCSNATNVVFSRVTPNRTEGPLKDDTDGKYWKV
jgi:hypothetical protein